MLEDPPASMLRPHKDLDFSEPKAVSVHEVVGALLTYPEAMQRPVLVGEASAIICRPLERLVEFVGS